MLMKQRAQHLGIWNDLMDLGGHKPSQYTGSGLSLACNRSLNQHLAGSDSWAFDDGTIAIRTVKRLVLVQNQEAIAWQGFHVPSTVEGDTIRNSPCCDIAAVCAEVWSCGQIALEYLVQVGNEKLLHALLALLVLELKEHRRLHVTQRRVSICHFCNVASNQEGHHQEWHRHVSLRRAVHQLLQTQNPSEPKYSRNICHNGFWKSQCQSVLVYSFVMFHCKSACSAKTCQQGRGTCKGYEVIGNDKTWWDTSSTSK